MDESYVSMSYLFIKSQDAWQAMDIRVKGDITELITYKQEMQTLPKQTCCLGSSFPPLCHKPKNIKDN